MMTQEEYQQYVEQSRQDAHIENMWGKPARDIITGISNNTNVRPVRAIWELVQNARDVVLPGHRAKIVFKRGRGQGTGTCPNLKNQRFAYLFPHPVLSWEGADVRWKRDDGRCMDHVVRQAHHKYVESQWIAESLKWA